MSTMAPRPSRSRPRAPICAIERSGQDLVRTGNAASLARAHIQLAGNTVSQAGRNSKAHVASVQEIGQLKAAIDPTTSRLSGVDDTEPCPAPGALGYNRQRTADVGGRMPGASA